MQHVEDGAEADAAELTTVLLVDGDPTAREELAFALQRAGRFRVEQASSAQEALAVLEDTVIGVILTELRLPDAERFELLERLGQQDHLAAVPSIAVTADSEVDAMVRSFELGASDYVTKPFAVAELVARMDAALRARRGDRRRRVRHYSLAGDFSGADFSDLLHMLQLGRRSGYLRLLTPTADGRLIVVEGDVFHATFGNIEGEEAVYRFMAEPQGQFEFDVCQFDLRTVRNTVALSTTALLMEGARRVDSCRREHGPGADPTFIGPVLPSTDETVELPGLLPAPQPRIELVDDLLETVSFDGELRLLDPERLYGLIGEGSGDDGQQLVLVADRAAGVRALSSLARPLAPAEIETALSYGQHMLNLELGKAGRDHRVGVLHLDQDYPALALENLGVQPTAIMVAPRDGTWLSFTLQALIELEVLIARLQPSVLLGIGEATSSTGLRDLAARIGFGGTVEWLETSLDGTGDPLRGCLIDTLRIWAGSAEPETAVS